ncbi:hypothetical protein ACVQD4_002060 [Citrobacter freundii]
MAAAACDGGDQVRRLNSGSAQAGKPKWNAVVPPIIKKHHQKIAPLGISLVAFVSSIGRMQGRYGVES